VCAEFLQMRGGGTEVVATILGCRPELMWRTPWLWEAVERFNPPGWEARLYGRQDACRHGFSGLAN
jgi:hypothetical protein